MKKTGYIKRPSQEQKILNLLRGSRNNWIGVHRFMRLGIAQYNARIFGLRRKGYQIIQKFDIKDKTKSFYMLIESDEK